MVVAAVAAGLRVAPQTTGHNATPLESLHDAVLLKTDRLQDVVVDAERRTATVGAGVLWEDVVTAAGKEGLTALHGSSPNVGVAGYLLGGGLSWFARSHGLANNHIAGIDIVLADGRLVRATPRTTSRCSGQCAVEVATSASSPPSRSAHRGRVGLRRHDGVGPGPRRPGPTGVARLGGDGAWRASARRFVSSTSRRSPTSPTSSGGVAS